MSKGSFLLSFLYGTSHISHFGITNDFPWTIKCTYFFNTFDHGALLSIQTAHALLSQKWYECLNYFTSLLMKYLKFSSAHNFIVKLTGFERISMFVIVLADHFINVLHCRKMYENRHEIFINKCMSLSQWTQFID